MPSRAEGRDRTASPITFDTGRRGRRRAGSGGDGAACPVDRVARHVPVARGDQQELAQAQGRARERVPRRRVAPQGDRTEEAAGARRVAGDVGPHRQGGARPPSSRVGTAQVACQTGPIRVILRAADPRRDSAAIRAGTAESATACTRVGFMSGTAGSAGQEDFGPVRASPRWRRFSGGVSASVASTEATLPPLTASTRC